MTSRKWGLAFGIAELPQLLLTSRGIENIQHFKNKKETPRDLETEVAEK